MLVVDENAKRRLRLLIGIGVFLLIAETAVVGSWRLFGFRVVKNFSAAPPVVALGNNEGQATNHPFFDAAHHPMMVMIDNSPEARPSHSGLSAAAIVYETLVEGGATRLGAVFAGAPPPTGGADRIGPVRSARPVFTDIVSEWQALYWHAGGSPEALAQIKQSSLADLNEISYLGPRYFWRDRNRPRPHNLFTDGERMKLAFSDLGLKNPLLTKEGEGGGSGGGTFVDVNQWQWGDMPAAASSSPATTIAIDFSPGVLFDVEYDYDDVAGNYARVMAGRPHVDRQTSAQIAVDNIIVQRVPAERYYASGYGRLIINVIGQGPALFFRDGRIFNGRWRKASRLSQTEWLMADGAPFSLKPGSVWVEIVPGRREVKYE